MQLPKQTTVAVADGTKFTMFVTGDAQDGISLSALPDADMKEAHAGSGGRHHNSAANPSNSQIEEDDFSAGVAAVLNKRVESGEIQHLYVVAPPKALGELRKHYSKRTSDILVGELAKDLTGHSTADIEKALSAAA